MKVLSRVQLFATLWTVAHQAPPSMGFSRQEHWSGLPSPSPKGTIEKKKVKSLSRVQLFATLWTVAYQAPPSMGFSRQEHRSGLPFPSPPKSSGLCQRSSSTFIILEAEKTASPVIFSHPNTLIVTEFALIFTCVLF